MPDSKLVWTSDPEEARRLREAGTTAEAIDVDPAKQTIRVTLDRKRAEVRASRSRGTSSTSATRSRNSPRP